MRRLLLALTALLFAASAVAQTSLDNGVSVGVGPTTTAATQQPFSDSSTLIATDQFVQGRVAIADSSIPFTNITGGTYSFATLGSGATIVYLTSGGTINSILSIATPGTGYAVGDIVTMKAGNQDSYIRITGVSSGGVTSAGIIYGGSGYTTGATSAIAPAATFPRVFSASGTLASAVTVIIPNGTFLLGSQERTVFNNTTGGFTTTLCVSNGANACTGTTLVIPQGTANSTPVYWFTDGSTGVWQINSAAGAGALAIANNLSDVASAATSRTNLGVTATGADTTYAFRANNLSDLASAPSARTNLGLGTSATVNTGTSGATIPLLNGTNTWSGTQSFGTSTNLNGSGSGVVTTQVQAAAGTWNFNLPITAGSANQVLTSQGGGSTAMTWTRQGLVNVQTFTSGSGTYTATAGTNRVVIMLVGGGGGGGGTASAGSGACAAASGGNAGATVTVFLTTGFSGVAYVVGGGGAGATAGANSGSPGVSSTFAATGGTITATGGAGGTASGAVVPPFVNSVTATSAIGTGGTVNGAGEVGGYGICVASGALGGQGAAGANTAYGQGGFARNSSGAGNAANGFGAGGGGALTLASAAAAAGGNGSGGFIIVYEYS